MFRTGRTVAAAAGILLIPFASAARATLVRADFNDNTAGQLQGQGGGSGFAASSTWAGATGPAVVAGDLTAPASTHYALAQTAGTAQSLQAASTVTASAGQDNRAPAATLAGTVWFSFLVDPASSNARGGIGFNTTGATSADPRVLSVGTTLYVGYGGATTTPPGPITVSNQFTVGQTSLVVGRIIINDNGSNDRISVWVNPDVTALASASPPTPAVDTATLDQFGTGLSQVTVSSYTGTSGTASGIVDAVRLSDSPTAQTDVTGVPEPAAAGAFALSALGLLPRRRHKPRR
jgi:hypothetical protein